MSVVKSRRSQSKIEFEMIYFQVVDGVDNLVENQFYTDAETIQKNRWFVNARFQTLQKLTDDLLYNIKIANSIYPTCMAELEERRVSMDKAIGVCYAILTNYQRIMTRLRVPDNKYTLDIKNVMRMIGSLKAWRKSDNKFKDSFQQAS